MGDSIKTTAQRETGAIVEAVGKAAAALRYFEGRILNGHDELADPSYARAELLRARIGIKTMLQAFDRAATMGWTPRDE